MTSGSCENCERLEKELANALTRSLQYGVKASIAQRQIEWLKRELEGQKREEL